MCEGTVTVLNINVMEGDLVGASRDPVKERIITSHTPFIEKKKHALFNYEIYNLEYTSKQHLKVFQMLRKD